MNQVKAKQVGDGISFIELNKFICEYVDGFWLRDQPSTPLQTEEMIVDFKLSDNVFAKAKVPPTSSVFLWLGVSPNKLSFALVKIDSRQWMLMSQSQADVMLEYPVNEAVALLTSKLSAAQATLADLIVDFEFLREQQTTTELSMLRISRLN